MTGFNSIRVYPVYKIIWRGRSSVGKTRKPSLDRQGDKPAVEWRTFCTEKRKHTRTRRNSVGGGMGTWISWEFFSFPRGWRTTRWEKFTDSSLSSQNRNNFFLIFLRNFVCKIFKIKQNTSFSNSKIIKRKLIPSLYLCAVIKNFPRSEPKLTRWTSLSRKWIVPGHCCFFLFLWARALWSH